MTHRADSPSTGASLGTAARSPVLARAVEAAAASLHAKKENVSRAIDLLSTASKREPAASFLRENAGEYLDSLSLKT